MSYNIISLSRLQDGIENNKNSPKPLNFPRISGNQDILCLPSMTELPLSNDGKLLFNSPNPRQILRIALNLKYLIDAIIPTSLDFDLIASEKSTILNDDVIQLVYDACGGDKTDSKSIGKYRAPLIFALLNVSSWYSILSESELHHTKLYESRSIAAQQLCKIILDREESKNLDYMFLNMLLRRYSINENDIDSEAMSALELATDMHCTIVIASGGFQRCLKWLWRGWIVQSRQDPTTFIKDDSVSSLNFFSHFDPERIKTPQYQNILQIWFSIIFLVLYTIVVNSKDTKFVNKIDLAEFIFYVFVVGYVADEFQKFYYLGTGHLSFWTGFNNLLYFIVCMSMSIRLFCLIPIDVGHSPEYLDKFSYRILACAAPLVWSRLLLYLESEKFVGTMLVVLNHMMTESIVFFVLLFLLLFGFLQGFLGLDAADGKRDISNPIMINLVLTVLGGGDFNIFKELAPPFAGILYYIYSFIVSAILLNILVAFYSSAYQRVIENSDNEYMALMSQKTLRYIRAPDEDVYVAPLNVIELIISPILRFTSRDSQKNINYVCMLILYSPMLFYVAIKEIKDAKRINYNQIKKLPLDANEIDTIWDLNDGFWDYDDSLFSKDPQNGLMTTRMRRRETNSLQHEAEQSDKKFLVPKIWYKKVKKVSHRINNPEIKTRNLDDIENIKKTIEAISKSLEQLTTEIHNLPAKND